MDREDAIYLTAITLVAVGASFLHSFPAGAVSAGLMLAVPPLVSLFRSDKKGPPRQ